jgi:hypothetical protein
MILKFCTITHNSFLSKIEFSLKIRMIVYWSSVRLGQTAIK